MSSIMPNAKVSAVNRRSVWAKWIIIALGVVGVMRLLEASPDFRKVFPALVVLVGVLTYLAFKRRRGVNAQAGAIQAVRVRYPKFQPTRTAHGLAGRTGLLIDQENEWIALYSNSGASVGVYEYRDLMRTEVIEDGGSVTSTARTSQALGAIVGKALVGPFGFLVGGLSGKTRTKSAVSKIAIAITVNDAGHPLWTIELLDEKKPMITSAVAARNAIATANELHALVSVLIRKADDEEKNLGAANVVPKSVAQATTTSRTAFADEFLKLSKLKEQGILSESEFSDMKTALIKQASRND